MEKIVILPCSGCGVPKVTVSRKLFDGMCCECTNRALYDEDFAKKAKARNEELKKHWSD